MINRFIKFFVVATVTLIPIMLTSCENIDKVESSATQHISASPATTSFPIKEESVSTEEPSSSQPTETIVENGAAIELYGLIGTSKIHMRLVVNNEEVTGEYYYDKYKENISLSGSVSDNQLVLSTEFLDDTYENFYAIIGEDYKVSGVWTKGGKILPLNISPSGAAENPIQFTEDILALQGDWNGVHTNYFYKSSLRILPISNSKLYFIMDTINGGNLGNLEGFASYKDGKIIYSEYDYNDKEIQFEFAMNKIKNLNLTVTDDNYEYACGGHTWFDNEFTKHEVDEEMPKSVDFLTNEQNTMLKNLLGEKYERFAMSCQYWSDCENIDGFQGAAYTFRTNGLGQGGIIVINNTDNTIMIAVADEFYSRTFLYFSNDDNFQNPPKTIEKYLVDNSYSIGTQKPLSSSETSVMYSELSDLNFEDLTNIGFTFASGAGAWSTEVEISPDGTFSGLYHDSDAGDSGTDYPNGTRYYCNFSGKFSLLKKIDNYTYSMKCISITQEEQKGDIEVSKEDGVRYIFSTPYGFDNADEFILYLPGKKISELPQEYIDWVSSPLGKDFENISELDFYGLYNVAGKQGFWGGK